MEEFDEDETIEEFLRRAEDEDIKQLKDAMNRLIDPVTKFIALENDDNTVGPEDFEQLVNALANAQFVVNGVMYSYGFNICTEDHDEEEDDA